jgi:hypothetical protein
MELNFDEEALKLFRKLNLSATGAGQASAPGAPSRYNPLDPVFQAVDCRAEEERLDEHKKVTVCTLYTQAATTSDPSVFLCPPSAPSL